MSDRYRFRELFKKLQSELKRQPTKQDWNDCAYTPSDMVLRRQFKNWTGFLDYMGLKPTKFLPTKNGLTRKGVRNKKRKKCVTNRGYIKVFEPDHPCASVSGYVLEHRMVAFDNGILTNLSDDVHHINENKKDNRPENLQALSSSEHAKISTPKGTKRPRRGSVKCIYCNTLTASKYGLCTKHYRKEWRRGTISVHEHPELVDG